jgi:16S rRNA (uracil1498-N3)-methyltransferase
MPHNRFYLPLQLQAENTVTLEGDEFNHLKKVMRAAIGDTCEICNGQGLIAEAEVLELSKKSAELRVTSATRANPPPPLTLFLALTKQSSLEWALEKVTELGVTNVTLFPSQKSERSKLSENHKRRLDAILISALKQSGRAYLPRLEQAPELLTWDHLQHNCFFGTFDKQAHLLFNSVLNSNSNEWSFIVGPESGFTDKEEKHLKDLGAQGVSLGENILRAETAAVTATALLSHALSYRSSEQA